MEMKDAEGASCKSSGIKDDLFQFPCLFNHSFLDTLSHPRLEGFLRENDSYAAHEEEQQQQQELQIDHDDSHTNKVPHLSVLFLWLLGRRNEAEERAQRQLQAQPNDVISLSSLTFICWSKGDHAGREQELLGRLVALRDGDPHMYSQYLQAAKETLISLYKRCIDDVHPFVLSKLLEKMLTEDPSNSVVKYHLATMLKRFSQPMYITQHPGVNFTSAIRRSMQLFFELKNAETEAVPVETRGMAAAELGQLVAWRSDLSQRRVVDQEMERLGIKDAIECFDEALRVCPDNPGVLMCIGRAMQYYDLEKSKELLEKAVTLVPDRPKAHHYLALTLRMLVNARRNKNYGQRPQRSGNYRDGQPNWNQGQKSREFMLNKKKRYWLRRDEEHVNEMIEHFKMAVECSTTGPDFTLRFSLAQSYVSLGEYKEAFEQLSVIVDKVAKPDVLGGALDDAYVIYAKEAEKARGAASWRVRHNPGESTLTLSNVQQCLRNVTVIVECQLLQEHKANSSNSQDDGDLYNLTTLFEMVRNKEFSTTPRGRALTSPEPHFVECLIDCAQQQPLKAMVADGLPGTTRGLSGARRGLDSDMDRLEKASRNSYRNGCFDDAAMLLILRRWLVEMNGKPQVEQGTGAESASPDSPDVLLVKSCVQAASPRLQEGYAKHDFDYLFQRSLAKFFFRLSFERALAARLVNQVLAQPPDEVVHSSRQHSSSGYQVLILTERNATKEDQGPEKDVQYILGDVCGLAVTTIDLTEESAGHHHLTQAVDKAQTVLIVVGDADMSPEFSAAASAALPAPGASLGDRFVTMLLDGTSLPSCLQGHRWFPWQQERLALAKDSSGSKDAASAACQLFANVLGVDVEL